MTGTEFHSSLCGRQRCLGSEIDHGTLSGYFGGRVCPDFCICGSVVIVHAERRCEMQINVDAYLNHEWEQQCRADDDEQEMIIYWGERCSITQEGCCVCDAWKRFDTTGEVVKC